MAIDTEFVSTAEVISNAVINSDDFDPELVGKFILPSQRQYIKPLLGDDYYEEFLDGSAVSAEDTELMDKFIKPTLSWYTLYESLPFIRRNITAAGIMINNTEFSEQTNGKDYDYIRKDVLRKAEMWEKELKAYVEDTQDDDATAFEDLSGGKDSSSQRGIILYD